MFMARVLVYIYTKVMKNSKKIIVLIITAVVIVTVGVAVFVLRSPKDGPARVVTNPDSGPNNDANNAQRPAASSTVVTLRPGLVIDRGVHDTSNPADLWVLVSKTRPLTDTGYTPAIALPGVKVRTDKSKEEQSVGTAIVADTQALFAAAVTAGYDFMLSSGYRSSTLQQTYYSNYVAQSGEQAANKFSAKPGQSEHQTGLAFDMNLADKQCYLDTCLGDLPAGKWLAAHAHAYGFIIRYPLGKEDITGYQYEPWHVRYVGAELAKALYESGLTLDEAVALIDAVPAATR